MKFANYIGIITVVTMIISTCGCLDSDTNQDITEIEKNNNGTCSVDGISFKCPDNWEVFKVNDGNITIFANPIEKTNTTSYTSSGRVIQTKSGKIIMENLTQFRVSILDLKGISDQEAINYVEKNMIGGERKVSSSVIKVDGNKAFKEVYYTDILNTTEISEYIYFVKNGKTYVIESYAPNNVFKKEKTNFNIILNSFKLIEK